MSELTITVSENRLKKLQEESSRLGVSVDDLILFSIDEILSRPDAEFQQILEYVAQKNAELYRRLS